MTGIAYHRLTYASYEATFNNTDELACPVIEFYLIVGPCALDFSKLRNVELLWSDPPADELVQRNRIQATASPPANRRPALHV